MPLVVPRQRQLKLIAWQEFQFEWTAPGGQYNAHRLGTPVMAKALGWQRLRTNNPRDPFFKDFVSVCHDGLERGIRSLGEFQKQTSLAGLNSTHADPGVPTDWISVPCFKLALEAVSRMTTSSFFGQSAFWDKPDFLDMCCTYADAVPRDAMVLHCIPSFLRPYVFNPRFDQAGRLAQ